MKNEESLNTINENLVFIDNDSSKSDLLEVDYIINKSETYIAAIKTYLDLIQESSVLYGSYHKFLNKLQSLYGATLKLSCEVKDFDYVIRCRIISTKNKYIKGFKNVQLECIRFIDTLIKNGHSFDQKTMKRIILRNITDVENLDKSDEFTLFKDVHNNYLPNFSFGNYPYGTVEEYKKIKDVDFYAITKALKNCYVLVIYNGDCQVSALRLAKQMYQPSPLIPPLKIGDYFIKDDLRLVRSIQGKKSYIANLYSMNEAATIKTMVINTVINEIMTTLVKDKYLSNYLLPNNLKVTNIYSGSFYLLTSEIERDVDRDELINETNKLVNAIHSNVTEEIFNSIKDKLIIKYKCYPDNIEDYTDFIYQCKLISVSHDLDQHIQVLNNLSLEELKKVLLKVQFMGSIAHIGEKGE